MHIDKVAITYGRMRVFISFDESDRRYTDERVAALALKSYPSLKAHSCINALGPTFGAVMDRTSIAHLMEHLIIAEQSEMARRKGVEEATFVGVTHWVDEDRGLAEIQVSFIDDLDAVHALSRAEEFISSL